MPQYVEWFQSAFPDEQDPVTFDNFAKAIEAYEATLVTPAPFDAYLNGDDLALTDQEKLGLELFVDAGCAGCHGGVNIGGNGYYPFGLIEKPGAEILPAGDKGRFTVTETADDEYVFRAAPLRNIAVTAPYFHSGKVWDLKTAVSVMATSQLGADMDDEQIEAITAFLGSLTGKMPEVVYPILPAEAADTPRPTGAVLPN
jgi:cytochrome c peroxidase